MKDDYREVNGRTVKYDSDPTNDYGDGYNAGRRYKSPKESKWPWILLALLILAILPFLFALGWMFFTGDDVNAKPTPTVSATSTVNPTVSKGTPATLPAVGRHD